MVGHWHIPADAYVPDDDDRTAPDWHLYDTCPRPTCQARTGEPCRMANGAPLAYRTHLGRPTANTIEVN